MALDIEIIKMNIGTLLMNNDSLMREYRTSIAEIQSDAVDTPGRVLAIEQQRSDTNQSGRQLAPLPLDATMKGYHAGRVLNERIRSNVVEVRLLLQQIAPTDVT